MLQQNTYKVIKMTVLSICFNLQWKVLSTSYVDKTRLKWKGICYHGFNKSSNNEIDIQWQSNKMQCNTCSHSVTYCCVSKIHSNKMQTEVQSLAQYTWKTTKCRVNKILQTRRSVANLKACQSIVKIYVRSWHVCPYIMSELIPC